MKARVMACLVAILASNAPVQASAALVTMTNCREVFAFVDVDRHALDAYVPERFELYGEPSDPNAQVMVTSRYCDSMTINGATRRDTHEARFGAVVTRPKASTTNCGTPDIDVCNFYTFFWAADNPQLVGWLRDGTGMGPDVTLYVKELHHAYSHVVPPTYESVEVVAPPPTPSPFRISGRVTKTVDVGSLTANWWAETDKGIVRLQGTTPAQEFGYGEGEVTPTAEGTLMSDLFDGAEAFSGPFTASGLRQLTYSKSLVDPCRPCS